jgi:V/A-type H+/Na+-transporting ATPase subunit A
MITVAFEGAVSQNEVGYACLGDRMRSAPDVRSRAYSRQQGRHAGLRGHHRARRRRHVEFTGEMLSAELGPGLLTRSTTACRTRCRASPSNAASSCSAAPTSMPLTAKPEVGVHARAKTGDRLTAGETLGTVPEGIFEHRIMVPFRLRGDLDRGIRRRGGRLHGRPKPVAD